MADDKGGKWAECGSLGRKGLGEAARLEEKSHFYTDQQAEGGQL